MLRAATRVLAQCRYPRTAPAATFSASSSASAVIQKDDTAPTVHGLIGRYATALYNSASKASKLEAVKQDIDQLQEMRRTSSAFNDFLKDPTLPRSLKGETLEALMKKAGFSEVSRHFMMVLAENGRTAEAEKIMKTFQEMMMSQKGDIVAQLTTCGPVPEWELALIRKELKKSLCPEGQSLTIETGYDYDLLGGFTVQVGDKFMDCSTRTELRKLQTIMDEAIVDLQ